MHVHEFEDHHFEVNTRLLHVADSDLRFSGDVHHAEEVFFGKGAGHCFVARPCFGGGIDER